MRWRQVAEVGQLKGLDRIFVLPALQMQALSARNHDLEVRARRKQFSDLDCSWQDLLKVVEDDERPLGPKGGGQCVQQRL